MVAAAIEAKGGRCKGCSLPAFKKYIAAGCKDAKFVAHMLNRAPKTGAEKGTPKQLKDHCKLPPKTKAEPVETEKKPTAAKPAAAKSPRRPSRRRRRSRLRSSTRRTGMRATKKPAVAKKPAAKN